MFFVYFGLLAALGAGIRYSLSGADVAGFPVGNLIANVVGSFLIGLCASGVLDKYFTSFPKAIVMVAFLGALTTFSSYSLEVIRHMEEEKWLYLTICIFSHNLLSISACYIGLKSFQPAGL